MASNPYINKVIFNNNVLIDISGDTVASNYLLNGITAHGASGAPVVGSVIAQTYYTGGSEPSSSLGSDGDLYFKE